MRVNDLLSTRKSIFWIWLLVIGILITGCSQASSAAVDNTPASASESVAVQGRIVAVGDSLTEGLGVTEEEAYPAQLQRRLQEDGYAYEVINAGVSGETSSGTRSRIEWVLNLEPDIVILETGPNDGLRGIDPTLTQENIDVVITALQEQDVIVLLAGMEIIRNLGSEYTTAFAAVYPTMAEKHNLILIPFFLEDVGGVRTLNQPDGVHPTAEGYEVVVDTIYPYVIQVLEQHQAQ